MLLARQHTALFLALLLGPAISMATESDRQMPIEVQADTAMVDEAKGSSVYRGNVIIVQGTLQVRADEVEIYSEGWEVTRIIARSNENSKRLAHYEQQTNEAKDMVVADARSITYLVQEERVQLAGRARLQQLDDVFTGELLHYDMAKGIVDLSSGGSSGRVNMTLSPKKRPQ